MTSFGFYLYRTLTYLLSPWLGIIMRRRVRVGKETSERLPQRWARYDRDRPDGRLVWLHAASVGESLVQITVARSLVTKYPDTSFIFTCQTLTAAQRIRAELDQTSAANLQSAIQLMAPIDTPAIAQRFIRYWRPDLSIFAESEVWPNLLFELDRMSLPVALINARMTQGSLAGWRRWPALSHWLFSRFSLIMASDDQTASGLSALRRAPVNRVGNLKSAIPPPAANPEELDRWQTYFAGREVILAASTHPGEEDFLTEILTTLDPRPFLIIAPRHPERGMEISQSLRLRSFKVCQLSQDEQPAGDTDILVADTIGDMGLWYRIAGTVYLGGAHRPDIGGHNPLEAIRLGRPVLTGPHMFNFRDMMADLQARGVITIVSNREEFEAHYPAPPPAQSLLEALADESNKPLEATLAALGTLLDARQE